MTVTQQSSNPARKLVAPATLEARRSAAAKTPTTGTFDYVGSTDLQNAGKAGLVTVQGKISAILGTLLLCAFLVITFFPEQAKKLLQLAPSS